MIGSNQIVFDRFSGVSAGSNDVESGCNGTRC